jgi:hypothetical protein
MYRFNYFVAYAGPDEAAAIRIHDLLAAHGTVFLSRLQGMHGVWDEAIAAAQRDSLATVAILSSKSHEGFYLKEEIAAAIELYRQGRHLVIPLLLEPLTSAEIPYGIRRMQQVLVGAKIEEAIAEVVRISRLPSPNLQRPAVALPRIQITDCGGAPQEIELQEDDLLTLGRDPSNVVKLNDSHVSARHAEIFLRGGRIWVRDLGSTNGIYVNGRRIGQAEAIDRKCQVHLGRNGSSIAVLVDGAMMTVLEPRTGDA